jgi:hypothetical protein
MDGQTLCVVAAGNACAKSVVARRERAGDE